MKCRHCSSDVTQNFIDLGSAPPSNAFLNFKKLNHYEKWFPLHVLVCSKCWLVQTEDYAGRDVFFSDDYAYFSSYSKTWLHHIENSVNQKIERFKLSTQSKVVEIAANDGCLLSFVKSKNIPCYGIEPTASTAAAAKNKGIEIIEEFFSTTLAQRLAVSHGQADMIFANNVLAHVPDINDFVSAFSLLLKPNGVACFEFPHLLNIVEQNQFDTIYHEHYSYLSFTTVERIFTLHGLKIFDLDEIDTHGGSLRLFTCQTKNEHYAVQFEKISEFRKKEKQKGIDTIDFYTTFQNKANKVKNDLLTFLLAAQKDGLKVAAYGAAAKGNTLLNYAGIKADLISFVVDRNPFKQGRWLPGSRIPIVDEEHIRTQRPDFVLILPWNIRKEIIEQLSYIRKWNGQFVTAVPKIEIFK